MRTSTTFAACIEPVVAVSGGTGCTCRTRKSCAVGTGRCQMLGGTITDALLSTDVSVVGTSELTFLLVAGVVVDDPSWTVRLIRNGVEFPAASTRRPVIACTPGRSEPVASVSVAPFSVAVNDAGTLSKRSDPIEAIASVATAETLSTDVTTDPSAGVEDTSDGAVLSRRTPATTFCV